MSVQDVPRRRRHRLLCRRPRRAIAPDPPPGAATAPCDTPAALTLAFEPAPVLLGDLYRLRDRLLEAPDPDSPRRGRSEPRPSVLLEDQPVR